MRHENSVGHVSPGAFNARPQFYHRVGGILFAAFLTGCGPSGSTSTPAPTQVRSIGYYSPPTAPNSVPPVDSESGPVAMTPDAYASGVAPVTPGAPPDAFYVETDPPPVVDETIPVAPADDFVWVEGAWIWQGSWVWVPGCWVPLPYPGFLWVGSRYTYFNGRRVWISGYWRTQEGNRVDWHDSRVARAYHPGMSVIKPLERRNRPPAPNHARLPAQPIQPNQLQSNDQAQSIPDAKCRP